MFALYIVVMMKILDDFFRLDWPTEVIEKSRCALDMAWFKSQTFEMQSSIIKNMEELLAQMKETRKTGLADEIKKTEEKLKKLQELGE